MNNQSITNMDFGTDQNGRSTNNQPMTNMDFGTDPDGRQTINIHYSYPNDDEYDFVSYMERINFDKEKEKDIHYNEGFAIKAKKETIKKDIKNYDGIYSLRFGQKMGDPNPYIHRYSCHCGELQGKQNEFIMCEKCHTICKFVDDNFKMFGWIEIDPEYAILNPDMFKELDSLFGRSKYVKNKHTNKGSVLQNILDYDKEIDQDGHEIGPKLKTGEPYYGIGMIDFVARFDEIMEYYHTKCKSNKNKMAMYDDIMENKELLFIHNIPVFTTHLRPIDIAQDTMYYEKCNGFYNMMVRLSQAVNKNSRRMDRNPKLKNNQLYKLQMKYMELYDEVVDILSGKRGEIRMLISGRFNFSSRSVIRQNPDLRIDQVELPYAELVTVLEQQIINILIRTYNISAQDAWNRWFKSKSEPDDTIVKIIRDIIRTSCNGEGIPVIINRNPTISYGSILQMFCVGINFNYTMSVPLQILPPLAADFDGDVLNVFHILNDAFFLRAYEVFNPRNAMYISRNNGLLNNSIMVQRDTLINTNTLNDIGYQTYTDKELANIQRIKDMVNNL